MKEKILEYLKSEKEDFLDFISKLYPRDLEKISNNTEEYKDQWYPRKFFPTGIIKGLIYEADFNGFSFNMIPRFSKDERVLKIWDILKQLEETPKKYNEEQESHYKYRHKRFRINLYLNLSYALSPLYDIDTYAKIQFEMYLAMKKLHKFLKDKSTILAVAYDSVTYKNVNEEITKEKLNATTSPNKLKLRIFSEIIKFENLISYQYADTGTWITKKTTKTIYDPIKEIIVYYLKQREFNKALLTISSAKASQNKIKEWTKHIEGIKKQNSIIFMG